MQSNLELIAPPFHRNQRSAIDRLCRNWEAIVDYSVRLPDKKIMNSAKTISRNEYTVVAWCRGTRPNAPIGNFFLRSPLIPILDVEATHQIMVTLTRGRF
ncbi:MAG: hypothetical protein F6K42_28680 [Leptolyngbya sp. SIO1D8]|nr:hypothetical protein [Leptolyngbya sp. SIO1D8]